MIHPEVFDSRLDEAGQSQWQTIWHAFRKHRLGMIGLIMLLLILLGVIFVPMLVTDPYRRVNPNGFLWAAPMGTVDPDTGHRYWLGSDKYGRDNLSIVFEAGRLSLLVAFVPAVIILIIGFVVGAVAGYYGGWIDGVLMRMVDFLLALPLLPAYLMAIRVIHYTPVRMSGLPPQENALEVLLILMTVFVLFGWIGVSRLVRGIVLSMRSQAYIEAARALGASTRRIISRHLLPNTVTPMLIAGMFAIGDFIVMEAVLTYFGMGFRDPINPPIVSWGNLLAGNHDQTWYMTNLNPFEQIRGYLIIFPSILLFATVLSINLIGDALRDVLDPRRRA